MFRRFRGKSGLGAGGVTLTAFLLVGVVLAVPSFAAPEKIFSLRAPAGPLPSGPQTIQLTIKNETPAGNSSINSLEIVETGDLTIVGATAPSGNETTTASTIRVSNISPIKNRQTFTISVDVIATPADGCAGGSTWDAFAWTGSSFAGDPFRLLRTETDASGQPYSNLSTSVSEGCTLAFDPAPASTTVNTDITVGVRVRDSQGDPVTNDRPVTLTIPGTGITVNGATNEATDGTSPFTFTVRGTTAGTSTATAGAPGFTSIESSFILYGVDSSVSGQVWRDHDYDGRRGGDEQGMAGWTIGAFLGTGTTPAATATTGDDGTYTVTGLRAGETYKVCEFAPSEQPGYEYRGWIQSVPDANTLCADLEGAEPNGYTVSFPGPAGSSIDGRDFFNVRTITVPEDDDPETVQIDCGLLPSGGVFTVGDGINDPIGTVTVDPDTCKPGEYVFETWESGGEQFAAFYPASTSATTQKMPLIEDYDWLIDDDRTQHTLVYDDFVGAGERPMLFCTVDANGDFGFPPAAEGEEPHTSCLVGTTEIATETGVERHDTVYTEVDGLRKI